MIETNPIIITPDFSGVGERVLVWPKDDAGDSIAFSGFVVGKFPKAIALEPQGDDSPPIPTPTDVTELIFIPTLQRTLWGDECVWMVEVEPPAPDLANIYPDSDPPAFVMQDADGFAVKLHSRIDKYKDMFLSKLSKTEDESE